MPQRVLHGERQNVSGQAGQRRLADGRHKALDPAGRSPSGEPDGDPLDLGF